MRQPTMRPTRSEFFGGVKVDYKLVLNALGLIAFVVLMGLTIRRGWMTVDRRKTIRRQFAGRTHFFCSERCAGAFVPERHSGEQPACQDPHNPHRDPRSEARSLSRS